MKPRTVTTVADLTDLTRWGHDDTCTGVHYLSTLTIECAEHPQVNRIARLIGCHPRRPHVLRDRTLPDGSHIIHALIECRPVDQDALDLTAEDPARPQPVEVALFEEDPA